MPTPTYTLINSTTLTATSTTVTFSSIPNTYTDLVLRISARSDRSAVNESVGISTNDTGTNYSYTAFNGNGSSATSFASTGGTRISGNNGANGDTATASSFGSAEAYIPNYNSTSGKQISFIGAGETNATAASMAATAIYYKGTSAFTSLSIVTLVGSYWLTSSSFSLYGIKNS